LGLVEEWKRAVDVKEEVAVLSTYMSKAFDSLRPPLLFSKLIAYGFSECTLELLRSYFTERKNRVRHGAHTTSDWKDVSSRGCPQALLRVDFWAFVMEHFPKRPNIFKYA